MAVEKTIEVPPNNAFYPPAPLRALARSPSQNYLSAAFHVNGFKRRSREQRVVPAVLGLLPFLVGFVLRWERQDVGGERKSV